MAPGAAVAPAPPLAAVASGCSPLGSPSPISRHYSDSSDRKLIIRLTPVLLLLFIKLLVQNLVIFKSKLDIDFTCVTTTADIHIQEMFDNHINFASPCARVNLIWYDS